MGNRLVLIAGPPGSQHGSYARVIGKLGFRVPDQRRSGEDGGSEARWSARFHQRILRRSGVTPTDGRPASFALAAEHASGSLFQERVSDWLTTQFDANEQVAVNDARLTWLIPQWCTIAKTLGADVGLVVMLRHPLDCLAETPALLRDASSAAARVANWINVMLQLEHASREGRRSLVRTEDLRGDWANTIATSCQELGIPILDTATTAQIRKANLAASKAPRSPLVEGWEVTGIQPHLSELAEQVWTDLLQLQALGDSETTRKQLDLHRESYDALYEMAEGIARSSVAAARREGRAEERERRRTEPAANQRQSRLLRRAVRLLPHRWRSRVPVRWRKILLRTFARLFGH